MKRFFLFNLAFIFIISAGCKQSSEKHTSGKIITDDLGMEIPLDTLPQKIISLAPNITEALFAVGAGDKVVGVTDFCDYPPEAKSRKSVGSYLSPDFEAMISLQPDLVLMYVTNTSSIVYKSLSQRGVKIFACNPVDLQGIRKMIRYLGEITGKKSGADSVINAITLAETDETLGKIKDSAFIVISVNPLMTAGGKTYISEVCRVAGFRNIFEDQTIEYPNISIEELHSRNPSVYIIPGDTLDEKKFAESVRQLEKSLHSGISHAKIIKIDDDILFRPGPRITEALNILRRQSGK